MEHSNAGLHPSGVRFQTCSPAVSVHIMVSACSHVGQGVQQCARGGVPQAAAHPSSAQLCQQLRVWHNGACTMTASLPIAVTLVWAVISAADWCVELIAHRLCVTRHNCPSCYHHPESKPNAAHHGSSWYNSSIACRLTR